MSNLFGKISVLLIVTGILTGAFGAHALKETLSSEKLESYKTGVFYQLFNALALLVLSVNSHKFKAGIKTAMILILTGIILFSGSIYILATVKHATFMGPVTPLGGTLMIAGWVTLLFQWKTDKT